MKNNDIWTGVVEDRMDPLLLNRCRVRIFGVHTENKNLVPTDALPWASVILPTTAADSTSQLKEGDWVTGYFVDGDYDYPVILGTIPGIVLSKESRSDVGFTDPRTTTEKESAPSWPEDTESQREDEPDRPRGQAGDITGTPIEKSNENKEHVCNIAEAIKLNVILSKLKISAAIQWIRQKIEALFSSLNQSAFAQELKAKLKQLAAKLKSIKKVIDEINEFILEVAKLVEKIKEIIVWILSLPARLLAFLRECLTVFLSTVASAVSSSVGSFTDIDTGETSLLTELTSVTTAAVSVIESASETVESSQVILESVQELANPFDSRTYEKC